VSSPPANLLATIDSCEEWLVLALGPTSAPIDVRRACTGDDAALATVVDELQLLAHLCAPDAVALPAISYDNLHDPRYGYGVVASGEREALVPSFVSVLRDAQADPQALSVRLPGLSVGDYEIWRQLGTTTDVRALGVAWLTSPARRLAWDLTLLDRVGPTGRVSFDRVIAAAGHPHVERPDVDPTSWPQVHDCTPLHTTAMKDDAAVVRALRALAAPEWLWSRSQAITALLQRAATEPVYSVADFASDLREELPVRFGAAFEVPDDEPLVEFERELLRVAATLTPATSAARTVFAVARWLGYVLVKSPFHSNDAHVLAARLSGIRRGFAVEARAEDDVFHPRRLLAMLDTNVERWREFVVVVGASRHYLGEGKRLEPPPVTLVECLRRIAARPLSDAETSQEAASAAHYHPGAALGRHLASPWIARATLHRTRSPWLSELDISTFTEALACVDANPTRYGWLTESVSRAARLLPAPHRAVLASWWRGVEPSDSLRPHHLALAAAAAIREIGEDGLDRLDEQLAAADAEWRPFVAHALAVEARQAELQEVEQHFLDALAGMVDEPELPQEQRQRALAWWVQRLQADRRLLTPAVEARLRVLVRDPLVMSNSRLRLLLAQLGFDRPRAGAAR
jgi:hypothetical protein